MIINLSTSIRHWSAQKLSIFGRVHAARSYIGSKACYLASMVPPNPKAKKRSSAMLWAYVQNNSFLQAANKSNRHYSAWPRETLIQSFASGGLNSQDLEAQLKAVHAK